MIKIVFPMGAYGHFLSRCIFAFSNLNRDLLQEFDFDSSGSSHCIAQEPLVNSMIWYHHLQYFDPTPDDRTITILPCDDHRLDYFDNQWAKWQLKQTLTYILNYESKSEIDRKLQENWNHDKQLDDTTPIWILREWLSFFIMDIWQDGWSRSKYSSVNCLCAIQTTDIFDDFLNTIEKIFAVLNLELKASHDFIRRQHQHFVRQQTYHNIQKKCDQLREQIIIGDDAELTDLTLFDQAYLQHTLRTQGYEIRCDGLNQFPRNTSDLHSLIYTI